MYIVSSISLNMIPSDGTLTVSSLDEEGVKDIICTPERWGCIQGAIGHADTASIVEAKLNSLLKEAKETKYKKRSSLEGIYFENFYDRKNIKMTDGRNIIVAQYVGERLKEGVTSLPNGSKIEFKLVRFDARSDKDS